jgi:hypothetical protein
MSSLGAPELIVLFVLAVVIGGAFITIDAVTRPADRYRVGSKAGWVATLVFTNPLLTRWFGGVVWLTTIPIFIVAAVAYYATNRHRNPTPRPAWMWVVGGSVVAALIVASSALLLYSLRANTPPAANGASEVELSDAPDAAALAELREAGSDLSRPHAIAFLLFLPSEAAAARVARTLRERGFAVEVKESIGGEQWQARGTRMMVPDEAELTRLRGELDSLADAEGGQYGGWRAPVVPPRR